MTATRWQAEEALKKSVRGQNPTLAREAVVNASRAFARALAVDKTPGANEALDRLVKKLSRLATANDCGI